MDKLEKVSVTVRPPDWQLPTGVDHGLWDYLHNPNVAHGYDASLTGSTLFVADERFVAKHCPKPGWLIDLGCGTGRLLLTFAQRGYRVLGVDLSASMLTVAKEKAEASNIPINLLQANLADLNVIADQRFPVDHKVRIGKDIRC